MKNLIESVSGNIKDRLLKEAAHLGYTPDEYYSAALKYLEQNEVIPCYDENTHLWELLESSDSADLYHYSNAIDKEEAVLEMYFYFVDRGYGFAKKT